MEDNIYNNLTFSLLAAIVRTMIRTVHSYVYQSVFFHNSSIMINETLKMDTFILRYKLAKD